MSNNKLEAAFFDLAGVLFTDGFADLSRYEENFGIPTNALQIAKNKHWLDLRIGKITEREFWRRTFIDAGVGPYKNFIEMVRKDVLDSHVPYEITFEMAKSLKLAGIKVGIMSNTCKEWLSYLDKKYRLSKLFNPIITSYELGYPKPHGRYFSQAIKKYGIDPYKSLFLDDQEDNVIAAKSVGFRASLFRPY
jgi:FMN phosphatase YigB (HAD superfamily)